METKQLIGYDDGTKDYLGRKKNTPREEPKTELAKAIVEKWNYLKEQRLPSEKDRWEACSYVRHRMKQYSTSECPIKETELYNSTGVQAYDNFVDGFMGNLISSALRWFDLKFTGPDFEDSDAITGANDFLEIVTQGIYKEFEQTNFYPMDKLASKDVIAQGISAEFILEDPLTGGCVYQTIEPWEFWVDRNSRKTVDTIFYRFDLTSQQAYERLGDKTPPKILNDMENGAITTVNEFVMAIYPREGMYGRTGGKLLSTNKPFAATLYCTRDNMVVEESGFDTFPVAVHIWDPNGDSAYCMSPVMRNIAEFKRLNKLSYKELKGVDKQDDPAMAIPLSMKGKLSLDPGSHNYFSNMENLPQPIQQVIDLSWADKKILDQEDKVRKLMYNDLFKYLMEQNKVLTATQAKLIKNEELVLLSAIFGSTQQMKINPIIKRTLQILSKNKRIPAPPKELTRIKNPLLKIQLDGPLARNLRTYSMLDGIQSSLEVMQQFLQMQQPASIDNINTDVLIRKAMIAAGIPQTALREQVEVMKMRAQKQQMLQQQMAMQQAQQQSEINRNNSGQGNMNNAQGANQNGPGVGQ